MGDEFLRILLARFIFCYAVLRLHRAFKVSHVVTSQRMFIWSDFLVYIGLRFLSIVSATIIERSLRKCANTSNDFGIICFFECSPIISRRTSDCHRLILRLADILLVTFYSSESTWIDMQFIFKLSFSVCLLLFVFKTEIIQAYRWMLWSLEVPLTQILNEPTAREILVLLLGVKGTENNLLGQAASVCLFFLKISTIRSPPKVCHSYYEIVIIREYMKPV